MAFFNSQSNTSNLLERFTKTFRTEAFRMGRRKVAVAAASMGLVALAAGQAHAQERIELKLSHYLVSTHPIITQIIEPWAKALEEKTKGKVTVRIFPGSSPLGNAANQFDQVQSGVVDIAIGLQGTPRGRFPRTGIVDIPFLTTSADQASRMLWAMYPKYLKEDYKGVKVLALFAHNPGVIHTGSRKVEKMEDLKGLRMRAPTPVVANMFQFLGATSVGMPPGQIYESMQGGVIDGFGLPWDPIASYKLAEVTKYHLVNDAYTTSFWISMNERKYNSLSADVRAVIDELSGQALVAKFGPVWDKADEVGLAAAKARGNVITKSSEAERKKWIAALQPMIEQELVRLEKEGVANAREIYAEMQRHGAAK